MLFQTSFFKAFKNQVSVLFKQNLQNFQNQVSSIVSKYQFCACSILETMIFKERNII